MAISINLATHSKSADNVVGSIVDEDDMVSDSAVLAASEQSVKAYVLAGTLTLANKTLTTPVVASFYQDAGKTKLMTTPNTASDTLAALAATQTLTNKTLTAPIITSPVMTHGVASHNYAGAAVDWTLSAAELKATHIFATNANGAVNAIAVPTAGKEYRIVNGSGQALTFLASGQTGVVIASTKAAIVVANAAGTDFVRLTPDA